MPSPLSQLTKRFGHGPGQGRPGETGEMDGQKSSPRHRQYNPLSCSKPGHTASMDDTDDTLHIPQVVSTKLQSAQNVQPFGESGHYQSMASKLIDMVNDLRAAGADVALDLPTIVVCGQQSAGKSSVVEVGRCPCSLLS